MIAQAVILMALALAGIIASAYLLGEWRGSRHTFEPLPPERMPAPVDYVEVLMVEDMISTAQITVVTASVEEAERVGSLAVRYRRQARLASKRLEAVLGMLLGGRRPSEAAIASAVVEVDGREVPVVPRSLIQGEN